MEPPPSAAPTMSSENNDKTTLVHNEVSAAWRAPEEVPPSYTSNSEMFHQSLDDQKIQRHFIRKVFVILGVQLLFTFGLVCTFTFSSDIKVFVQKTPAIYYPSFAVFLVTLITLAYCKSVQRRYPWNIICLAFLTLSLSYMVAMVASFNDISSVMIALGSTVAVCLGIILFSSQTRLDLTCCYGFLLVLSIVVFMFGFFCIFFYNQVLQVVYGSLGALLFSLFLAVDIQLVLGNKQFELSPEDYVLAVLILYLDIINIFIYLLMIVSAYGRGKMS
ncbi:protein lifeguard 1-like isoform X1 [Mobula birostris]|uniref:protein lifeguard 1-like isoform X1 n=2 Tax=Mobula birostris TaxID=1983395 RepID=UPI003B28DA28